MPKIIENIKERLMEAARKQIRETSYQEVTIRSVATECGIATGTVYNYFSSKEELISSYILDDWMKCVDYMYSFSSNADAPKDICQCIYDQLLSFCEKHHAIFHDENAVNAFHTFFRDYHNKLRSQLAEPMIKHCPNLFTAEFIAESLLTWTTSQYSFDDIWGIVQKCFL